MNASNLPPIGQGAAPFNTVTKDDFEGWMKMVRTKRVKATNAFTIQLIDAFYSMVQGQVLSNDESRYTFQEATHTLGGCLTVYKNRIARVKDDTSRLLVGVTEKRVDEREEANGEEEDSDNEDEPGSQTARSKKSSQANKRLKQTGDPFLVPAKKLEIDAGDLKTAIDPLLRKMSADFDKRGAGALLQYSLRTDLSGRFLLDADTQSGVDTELPDKTTKEKPKVLETITEEDENEEVEVDVEMQAEDADDEGNNPDREQSNSINDNDNSEDDGEYSNNTTDPDELALTHFHIRYFSNFDPGTHDTLPLIDSITRAVTNPKEGTNALVKEMQAWAISNPADTSNYLTDNNAEELGGFDGGFDDGFDDEDNGYNFNDGLDDNGGELNGLGLSFNNAPEFDDPEDDEGTNLNQDIANLSIASVVSSNIPADGNWQNVDYLKSLDNMSSNWAGASYWKVRRLHSLTNEEREKPKRTAAQQVAASAPPTLINFDEEPVSLDDLFAKSAKSINLPKAQQLELVNILPVDMHFTTKGLTSLYQLPDNGIAPAFKQGPWRTSNRARIGDESLGPGEDYGGDFDDAYDNVEPSIHDDGAADLGNYYYESWDPKPTAAADLFKSGQTGGLYGASQGNQLNFARVAKRVDIRRLKENVWNAIEKHELDHQHERNESNGGENQADQNTADADGDNEPHLDADKASDDEMTEEPKEHPDTVGLLNIIRETQPLYSENQRSELSPAMYFISLLHLSNEKGLALENTSNYTDVNVVLP